MKKIIGAAFIILGLVDLIASWVLPSGSPFDPIIIGIFGYEAGEVISQFSAYAFMIIGGVIFGNDESIQNDGSDAN